MRTKLDFEGLSSILLSRSLEFVARWLPGGKVRGREYICGGLRGGPGESLSVNLETGRWAEFAGNDKGGDLISLYAAIEGLKQGEAAKRLSEDINFKLGDEPRERAIVARPSRDLELAPPPADDPGSSFLHGQYHKPMAKWAYRDAEGHLLFYVARYQSEDGKKFFFPWSYTPTEKRWVQRGWPAPRPLYGLDQLAQRPLHPVLIVEGEKACEAARVLAGHAYVVLTWPNGARAAGRAQWQPIYGRRVLIWPDADQAGVEAAQSIVTILSPHCPEIKVLNVEGLAEGWDAADALDEGWDWERLRSWAKPRAQVVEIKAEARASANGHGNGALAVAQSHVEVNVSTEDDPDSTKAWAILWEELGVAVTMKGFPIYNVENALRVIENKQNLKGLIWFDVFHQKYYTMWRADRVREWSDVDTLNLTVYLQRDLGLRKFSDDMVQKAVTIYAHQNPKNAPRDWMETLVWDGVARVENFFTAYMGTVDSEYVRAAARNFWVGMIARIYRPGCQLDNMIVLEGAQGIGKTRALRAIGNQWYTEAHESVTSKDFFMVLHGKLIIEIAELDSFSRAEVTRIKQVVSCPTDRYRAPYGRTAADHPRMSIFVGTTNEHNYLKDVTGGRRFWPIVCTEMQPEKIEEVRTQLFAEAVSLFKGGANWYEMPASLTEIEQESRREGDEWEDIIHDWVLGKSEVLLKDVAVDCLKIDIGKLDVNIQRRLGKIMRKLGWVNRNRRDEGIQRKVWIKNELPFE